MASKAYYKNAIAGLVFLDLSHGQTTSHAIKWKANIDETASLPDGSKLPCILVANKCDLLSKEASVKWDAELEQIVQQHHFIKCIKTSVKENINVDETVAMVLEHVMQLPCFTNDANVQQQAISDTVTVSETAPATNNSVQQSKCCSSNVSSNVFMS